MQNDATPLIVKAGAKNKYFSAKTVIWSSKRVEALGERKFRTLPQWGHLRDNAKTSGTIPAIPGWLATMHVSWCSGKFL